MSELNNIVLKILEKGKGILAADESNGTMTKRLESVNVPSTPENRLLFRETLFTASCMNECIGGVILYDETIRQESSKKNRIPELISKTGSNPGIKVDTGAKVLAGSPDEKITEGLDGLRERLKEYYKLGAKFTKWRGVYSISKNYPSNLSIQSNAHALASYSALVQECDMVPIVEPEVLMDGEHSAKECYEKTSEVIKKWISSFIYFSAKNPEFHQVISYEMSHPSPRADWLIDNILKPLHQNLISLISTMEMTGYIKKIPLASFISILIGSANVFFTQAYQTKKLYQLNVFEEKIIQQHTETVISILFDGIIKK